MKFSILTLVFLHNTTSAVFDQDVPLIHGRKVTEGCGPCSQPWGVRIWPERLSWQPPTRLSVLRVKPRVDILPLYRFGLTLRTVTSAAIFLTVLKSRNQKSNLATSCGGPCSHEVCASDLNACSDTNPCVCLGGKAKSRCIAIEEIWLNPEQDCHHEAAIFPTVPKMNPRSNYPRMPPPSTILLSKSDCIDLLTCSYLSWFSGDFHLYADSSGDTIFLNLDKDCHPDSYCVGCLCISL